MTDTPVYTSSSKSMPILMGSIILVGCAILAMLSPTLIKQATTSSPKIVTDDQAALSHLFFVGAVTKKAKVYKPTSQYVEKGADKDAVTLSISKKDKNKPQAELITDAHSQEAIQRVVLNHQNDLIGCYAVGLQSNDDLKGRVDFHFRIAPDGHVAMIKITDSGLQDKPTEDCFVKKSKAWTFPKSGKSQLTRFDTHFNFVAD